MKHRKPWNQETYDTRNYIRIYIHNISICKFLCANGIYSRSVTRSNNHTQYILVMPGRCMDSYLLILFIYIALAKWLCLSNGATKCKGQKNKSLSGIQFLFAMHTLCKNVSCMLSVYSETQWLVLLTMQIYALLLFINIIYL